VVRPSDKICLELLIDRRIELRPQPAKPASTIFGLLERSNTEHLAIEEISDAAAAGWASEV